MRAGSGAGDAERDSASRAIAHLLDVSATRSAGTRVTRLSGGPAYYTGVLTFEGRGDDARGERHTVWATPPG